MREVRTALFKEPIHESWMCVHRINRTADLVPDVKRRLIALGAVYRVGPSMKTYPQICRRAPRQTFRGILSSHGVLGIT